MISALYIIIGLVCLAFAVKCFSNAYKITKGRKITAKLVDYTEVRQGKRIFYSPVYEYEDEGELKRYTSSQVFSYQEPFGTEKILLISENGEVSG